LPATLVKILAKALLESAVASNRHAPILKSILIGKRMVRSFLFCSVAGVEQRSELVFLKAFLSIGIQFGYESSSKVPDEITLIDICGLQLKSFKKAKYFFIY